jgi:hypothetical protein
LINTYNSSTIAALRDIFPEVDWNPSQSGSVEATSSTNVDFGKVEKGFWKSTTNQRKFMDWAFHKLGLRKLDDWFVSSTSVVAGGTLLILLMRCLGVRYDVDKAKFVALGHSTFIKQSYGSSLIKALQTIYPEHTWLPWRFSHVPRGFWNDLANRRAFMKWLSHEELKFGDDLSKWYTFDFARLKDFGAVTLLRQYSNSPLKLLKSIYPSHSWVCYLLISFGEGPKIRFC